MIYSINTTFAYRIADPPINQQFQSASLTSVPATMEITQSDIVHNAITIVIIHEGNE